MNRKNRILRKILSVSLAAAMTVGGAAFVLPAAGGESLGITVHAETYKDQGFYYQVSYGRAYITGLIDGTVKDLVIPEELNEYPVAKIYPNAFKGNKAIESVTIPEGVGVGNAAFYGCTALKEVTFLGDNYIDWYGFQDCTALEYIDLSNVGYFGKESFRGCSALRSIIFSDETTELYDGAFMDCSSLTSVSLPANIRKLNYRAFANCTSLRTVEAAAVENWGYWTFEGSTNIESVRLGDGVEYVPFEFMKDCTKLTSVELGKGVRSIGSSAFYNCGLKSIVIPESVETIEEGAFENCSALNSISLPKNLTNIMPYAFEGTPLAPEGEDIVYIDNHLYRYAGTAKTFAVKDGTTAICSDAFNGNNDLEKVVLPAGLTAIGSGAFRNCENLKEITAPDSLLYVGEYILDNTPWLNDQTTDVYLGKVFLKQKEDKSRVLLTAGTTAIADSAFAGDEAIRSIRFVNALKVIGNNAFSNCTNFSGLVFTPRVSEIGNYAFAGTKVKSVTLPETIKKLGVGAFASAEEIVIPGNMKSIPADMFSGSSALKKIAVPEGVTSIGKRAFANCPEVSEISLPSTLKTIGDYAFRDSSKVASEEWLDENVVRSNDDEIRASYALKTVTVPASVTSIGREAIGYCRYGKLTGFKMYGTKGSAAWKYAYDCGITFNDEYDVMTGDYFILDNCYVGVPTFRFNLNTTFFGKDYKVYYKREQARSWTLAGQGENTSVRLKNPGLYVLRVEYTGKDNVSKSEEAYISIAATDTIENQSSVSAETVTPGTKITVNGAASGGTGIYGYQYYYKKSTARAWSYLENKEPEFFYSDDDLNAYIPATSQTLTLRNTGVYDIKVVAFDPGLKVTSEKIMHVAVTSGEALANNSTASAAEVTAGTRVYLTGAASGGTGVYTYTYSYKRSNAAKWNVIGTENTTETTASFRPGSAGTYDAKVVITDADGKSVEKTFTVKVN